MSSKIIAFPHKPPDIGGPGTFQTLLTNCLIQSGWQVTYPEDNIRPDVIFVVAGTAKLGWLITQKTKGAKVVHRLDGLNWKQFILDKALSEKIGAKIRNKILITIRNHLADHVVYQSNFIKSWWYRTYGPAKVNESIIYNSTDLTKFTRRRNEIKKKIERIACVEGAVGDDAPTIKTIVELAELSAADNKRWEFYIYGDVSNTLANSIGALNNVVLVGRLPRNEMAAAYSMSDVYLALEINPPCPNSVVEALASGLPVVGYDTGSLSELILPNGGITVPYGGDPWRLDLPDVGGLYSAINIIDKELNKRSALAREMAIEKYDVNNMLQQYMEIIEKAYMASKKHI